MELEWLQKMLNVEFFKSCRHHPKREAKFYCINCMTHPFCARCRERHDGDDNNEDHHVLQMKADNFLYTAEIEDHLDISLICTYRSHYTNGVYLHQRKHGNYAYKKKGNCQTCNRSIPDKSSMFCSIACKFVGPSHLGDEGPSNASGSSDLGVKVPASAPGSNDMSVEHSGDEGRPSNAGDEGPPSETDSVDTETYYGAYDEKP